MREKKRYNTCSTFKLRGREKEGEGGREGKRKREINTERWRKGGKEGKGEAEPPR